MAYCICKCPPLDRTQPLRRLLDILVNTAAALMTLQCATSCFTGVESTRRVEMSRSDVQATLPTEEDKFVSGLSGLPLSEWRPGMEFVALDDRAALIFDSRTLPPSPLSLKLRGKTLCYEGIEHRITPGLDTLATLMFRDSVRRYFYPMKQQVANSLDIPMFTDRALIQRFDSMLRNRKLWITYPVWHTADSVTFQGLKYAPVEVESVGPGIGVYPVRINFRSGDIQAWLPVSLPGAGPESRRFSRQFSLSDPRLRHPGITDENWNLIQRQRVVAGMTKNEARLALGNPSDVSQGHNSAMMYELWQYPDGSYLMFADGLLQRFKLARQDNMP